MLVERFPKYRINPGFSMTICLNCTGLHAPCAASRASEIWRKWQFFRTARYWLGGIMPAGPLCELRMGPLVHGRRELDAGS